MRAKKSIIASFTNASLKALIKGRDLIQRNLLYRRDPAHLHQISVTTGMNRYPWLFETVQKRLEGVDRAKILSFGCSTGEEVFSLRKYFADADIHGTDINWANIRHAQAASTHEGNHFFAYSQARLEHAGPFHAIFCLAVLQRFPSGHKGSPSLRTIYPFEKFDRQLTLLDKVLIPGGVLVVYHTNYRFIDAAISANYDCLAVSDPGFFEEPRKYDINSDLLESESYLDAIFIKRLSD
ncbi:MAG: hypothetical protein V3W41_04020 [Planctomycetota bacterium]